MMADDACNSGDAEEIEEIASFMAQGLGYLQFPDENPDSCQIHRVHQLVRQIDRFAYEPSVLSIGPYHHSDANLQFMEKQKWRCLNYILKLNCTKSLRDYLLAICDLENQARACYCGDLKLDSKGFRQMLLLDGCFLLVYLRGTYGVSRVTKAATQQSVIPDDKVHEKEYPAEPENRSLGNSAKPKLDTVHDIELGIVDANNQSSDDADFSSCRENNGVPWYHTFALLDLFLLENQIPFFVIRKIHEVLVGSDMGNALGENVSNYIEENLQYFAGSFGTNERPIDFFNLLHLCHMYFKPRKIWNQSNHAGPQFRGYFFNIFCNLCNISHTDGEDELSLSRNQQSKFLHGGQVIRWHRAIQYHEAGIVFKKKEFNGQTTHSLLDVTFHDGVLEIPCLSLDGHMGALFRNMIAFEQTNPHVGNYVTAYVMFMSQLISRPDDVTLLAQRGIIVHFLHSDKVVSVLFTCLTKGVVFDFMGDFYLRTICRRMEMYYQNRVNRWIAWLRHNHLSNPWLGLALLAGLLVLFCTIAQTVLAVLVYVDPT
ncbi:unnamed protein product [Urochloa decumbens]|uniref:Uncharacterized protein n=1 Tax=Urochloa decumbens TaxID=240449 RepID=A0ABC9DQ70_9POAL